MEAKAEEKKGWKITKLVLNILFYTFIALLIVFSISNMSVKTETSIPSIFGKGYLVPKSDSMTGENEDSFTIHDLIFVKVVNDKNRDELMQSLKEGEGEIITFQANIEGLGSKIQLNTHRIIKVYCDAEGKVIGFTTKGDKAVAEGRADVEDVSVENVKGIYTGKWKGAGNFFGFLLSGTGFLVCVVLPTALFFIFEIVLLIMNYVKIQQTKNLEQIAAVQSKTEEELKEELRRQIMAEMEANKQESDKEKEI